MRKIFALLLFVLLLSQSSIGQNDSIGNTDSFILPKNQIAMLVNTWSESDGPYFGLEYNRLINSDLGKSNHQRSLKRSRYLHFGAQFSSMSKPNVTFDEHFLIGISDSLIHQRSNGSASGDYNLLIGVENQNRLLFTSERSSGIQLAASYYGILGYTYKMEQYIYSSQSLQSTQSGNISNNQLSKYPIIGERSSQYLRIGMGAFLGFDWVIAEKSSRFNAFIGLSAGFFNLSAAFRVAENIDTDPDNFYNQSTKSVYLHSDVGFNIRMGVAF
jgi:hypothetical protein